MGKKKEETKRPEKKDDPCRNCWYQLECLGKSECAWHLGAEAAKRKWARKPTK